jgi:hypothetical protein
MLIPIIFVAFIILAVVMSNNNLNNMNNHNSAKYAFYYLLSLVALIFTALSVGMIAFGIIDKSVSDALSYGSLDGQFKFATSALFIAGPIFYLISYLINKGLRSGDLDKDSGVRRWLTYFIILVSSLIILGVFIGIMNSFLSGEVTTSFILRMLSMIVIAALVFSFYFYDIKRDNVKEKNIVVRIFFIATAVLVLAAFVSAWFFIESPKTARAKKLDQQLISNIYSLESAVNSYYEKTKMLPENSEQLKNNTDLFLDAKSFVDSETGKSIDYKKTSDKTFEFCAEFRTNSFDDNSNRGYTGPVGKNHKAGYQCIKGELWNQAVPTKF